VDYEHPSSEVILELVRGRPEDNLVVILSGKNLTKGSLDKHFSRMLALVRSGEQLVLSYEEKSE